MMNEQKKPLMITGAVFALVVVFFVFLGRINRQETQPQAQAIPPQEFLSPKTGMMEPVAPLPSLKQPVPGDALAFAALARSLQMYQDARLLGKPDKVTQRQAERGIETTLYFDKQGGTVAVRYSGLGINQGVDVL